MDFKQKFEPEGKGILHGAGQSPGTFFNYWKAVEDYKPLIYMTYAKILNLQKWIDKIKGELEKFPNLMLQIGLKLVDEKGEDKTSDVLCGKYDKDLENFFKTIKDLKRSSFVRIGYEFDAKGKYNSDNFVKAWRYIVDMSRKLGVDNMATVWCSCPYHGTNPVEPYYPGDDYVDWFGIDLFGVRYFKDNQYEPTENFMELAKKHKKPVMVGESTASKIGVLDGNESWKNWFEPYFKWIREHEQVKAFCYINWDWAIDKTWGTLGTWGDCRIEDNEIVRKKYVEEMSNPRYVHNKLV